MLPDPFYFKLWPDIPIFWGLAKHIAPKLNSCDRDGDHPLKPMMGYKTLSVIHYV